MTANTSPIFTLTPIIGSARISTANTNRDGSGTLGTIVTGATDGTRVSRITIKANGNTTAGMIRLFLGDGAGNNRLWREIPVTSITVSATAAAFSYILSLVGESALVLPNGHVLLAGTHNAESFDVIGEGGNY